MERKEAFQGKESLRFFSQYELHRSQKRHIMTVV